MTLTQNEDKVQRLKENIACDMTFPSGGIMSVIGGGLPEVSLCDMHVVGG